MTNPGPSTFPRVHHISFVVGSIREVIDRFARSVCATWDGRIVHDPIQRVNVTFLKAGPADPQIELVEPASEDAPVARFLQQGGGLHHLCYEVDDLEAELRRAKEGGSLVVRRAAPAVAFDGRRIAWVYTADKLLVEYLER